MMAMGWVDGLGYAAVGLTIAQYMMRTMIPLRLISLCASVLFLIYGIFAPSYPHVVLNCVLFPLNAFRLREMMNLVKRVKIAAATDLSMEWFSTFSASRACRKGEVLFRKNDPADAMFYVVSGRYMLAEIGIEIGPGHMIGEIAMVTPDNRRTQSFECIEAGDVRVISYEKVKELYFQNPEFGFYFLRLITQRLTANYANLENRLVAAEAANRELMARIAMPSAQRDLQA